MKKSILVWLAMLMFLTLKAQDSYFQQHVAYDIKVKLEDTEHLLIGEITIDYTNNSPTTLEKIYFHLWPNAYQDTRTAFAKQQINQGSTRFYFAPPSERGGLSNLDFKVDGKSTSFTLDSLHADIGVLHLSEALPPNSTIQITTPFNLKIPASFSRLGHVGTSYQMTQWYPKPAVFDAEGWHPMPYLDMGEFYSEFGNYKVEISLPENYVVAATGVLKTEKEKKFIQEKIAATQSYFNQNSSSSTTQQDSFPSSSSHFKTIRFEAENVHDFAWFADKRFMVTESEVILENNKKVQTQAYFTRLESDYWRKATDYLNRAVSFYSKNVGNYPYPHATAVQSALSAGAGMEYPMITVIGQSGSAKALDHVITHEVGHNWFYGILAFNERAYPWLDEGINSYYDHRYIKTHYSSDDPLEDWLPNFLKSPSLPLTEIGFLHQVRANKDQASHTHSSEFERINYWISAYEKPARSLEWLAMYLGQDSFDQYMKGFYEKWKFKHPQPSDFQNFLEKNSGEKLDWFFEDLIKSTKQFDIKATQLLQKDKDYTVVLKNVGDIAAPFSVSALKNGKVIRTLQVQASTDTQRIVFEELDQPDKFVVDYKHHTLDVNRNNNSITTKELFKKAKPLTFQLFTGLEDPYSTQLFFSPFLGFNQYDGLTVGAAIHNIGIPIKKFEYFIMPAYGFHSKEWVGVGDLRYYLSPNSDFMQQIELGLSYKSFHFNDNDRYDYALRYQRFQPSINIKLNSPAHTLRKQNIKLRAIFISEEFPDFSTVSDTSVVFDGKTTEWRPIFELSYSFDNERPVNPFSFKLALEQQSYSNFLDDQSYLKATAEYVTKYTYAPKTHVSLRVFAGGFLHNTLRDKGVSRNSQGSLSLYSEAFNDYKYDEIFFARSAQTGFFTQQISLNDGGMKLPIGASQAGNLGRSNNFLVAVNLKADLPKKVLFGIPIKPYFDIGYFDNTSIFGQDDKFADQVVYSGGLMLDFLDGGFGIYFPLLNSSNAKDLLDQKGGFFDQVSFNINFDKFNPRKIRDRINF